MNSQKKALTYALAALGALAFAMIAFYYVQSRMAASGTNSEEVGEEIVREEKSEFVGIYSPADGPLEAAGKRIAFFTVNAKEDGGYLGSVKLDTIGTEEASYIECVDVKVEEKEFFLNCPSSTEGVISFNGKWEKVAGSIQVDGKLLWMQQGSSVLEQARRLQHAPL